MFTNPKFNLPQPDVNWLWWLLKVVIVALIEAEAHKLLK